MQQRKDDTVDDGTASAVRGRSGKGRAAMRRVAAIAAAAALAAGAGALGWHLAHEGHVDAGTTIVREQADAESQRHEAAEHVERSKITVCMYPKAVLHADGSLDVGIENRGTNGWSERVEIEQDGTTVFESGVLRPGTELASCTPATPVHEGEAVARFYRVDPETHEDRGSWQGVDFEIIREQS